VRPARLNWRVSSRELATSVLTVAAALSLAALPACRAERRSVAGERRVTDELGRQLSLPPGPPARVVSLAPNVTELLFALGVGDRVVGVDGYSDEPAPRLASLARVGSNYDPSFEAVLALRPALVITSTSANRRETAERLTTLGVPVYVTHTPRLADVFVTLRHLGILFEAEARARALEADLQRQVAEVRRQVAGEPAVPVLVAVWDKPLYVAGRDTFVDDLVTEAGGLNVTHDVTGFVVYPLEKILAARPAVIVMPLHGRDHVPLEGWKRWPELPAVQSGRVVGVDDALVSRAGPRLGLGAQAMARLLHPERFSSGTGFDTAGSAP